MAARSKFVRVTQSIARRMRFSLRFLLLVITAIAIACGTWISSAKNQKSTVESIRDLGGEVYYSHEMELDNEGIPVPKNKADPPGPHWLRKQLGIDCFDSVAFIRLYYAGNSSDWLPGKDSSKLDAAILHYQNQYRDAVSHALAFSDLQKLELLSINVRDEDFLKLAKLKNLRSLWLIRVPTTPGKLANIRNLGLLEELIIGYSGITNADMIHLQKLVNLTRLSLYGENITDQGLEHLSGLKNLKYLDLRQNKLTDESLRHLRNLTNLEELHLSHSPITGSQLELLDDLPNLRILGLVGCDIIFERWIKDFQSRNANVLVYR